jgi:hypothetical protein
MKKMCYQLCGGSHMMLWKWFGKSISSRAFGHGADTGPLASATPKEWSSPLPSYFVVSSEYEYPVLAGAPG